MSRRTLVLSLAASLLVATAAHAQDLPEDKTAIWSFQDENASVSSAALTDRYYVNGLHLGYVSGTDGVPDFLQGVGNAVWGGGQMRLSVNLNQQIFTPDNTAVPYWPTGDRPYAGLLYANFGLYRDVENSRSMIGLSLGMVGPWALAQQMQDTVHNIIGQPHDMGWNSQLHNEPLAELTSMRTWRLSMGTVGGLETDALPDLGVGLGNMRIFAQSGVIFRIGQGLNSDYGPPRIFPGPNGGDAFVPTRPFAWYVFLGGDGQGLMRDITLDGNDFSPGPSVTLIPYVGEIEAGFAIMVFGTRLTYTQIMQSQEFQHQKGGPHQMGSLALSVRF